MAGTAIAQSLEETTAITIGLKWPNDLLIDEQKIGGILCESFRRGSTETSVIIGFGVNVNLSGSDFPKDLKPMASSLQIHAKRQLDRTQLISKIIYSLEQGWETLRQQGQEACHLGYSARCRTLGQHVVAELPDGTSLEGVAQSIGAHGQLQILVSPSDTRGQSVKMMEVHAADIRHIRTIYTD